MGARSQCRGRAARCYQGRHVLVPLDSLRCWTESRTRRCVVRGRGDLVLRCPRAAQSQRQETEPLAAARQCSSAPVEKRAPCLVVGTMVVVTMHERATSGGAPLPLHCTTLAAFSRRTRREAPLCERATYNPKRHTSCTAGTHRPPTNQLSRRVRRLRPNDAARSRHTSRWTVDRLHASLHLFKVERPRGGQQQHVGLPQETPVGAALAVAASVWPGYDGHPAIDHTATGVRTYNKTFFAARPIYQVCICVLLARDACQQRDHARLQLRQARQGEERGTTGKDHVETQAPSPAGPRRSATVGQSSLTTQWQCVAPEPSRPPCAEATEHPETLPRFAQRPVPG